MYDFEYYRELEKKNEKEELLERVKENRITSARC